WNRLPCFRFCVALVCGTDFSQIVVHHVGGYDFEEAKQSRLVPEVKFAQRAEVVGEELEIGFLEQVVNQGRGRRTVLPAADRLDDNCGHQGLIATYKLQPTGLVSLEATPQQLWRRQLAKIHLIEFAAPL